MSLTAHTLGARFSIAAVCLLALNYSVASSHAADPCCADVNTDGVVSTSDFSICSFFRGCDVLLGGSCAACDLDCDVDVDDDDLVDILNLFQTVCAQPVLDLCCVEIGACCTAEACAVTSQTDCTNALYCPDALGLWLCDGDVDGDGFVTIFDTNGIQAAIDIGFYDCTLDVNCDDSISCLDIEYVQARVGLCDPPTACNAVYAGADTLCPVAGCGSLLGSVTDCDSNGSPDDCDILSDPSLDTNGNLVLDTCESSSTRITKVYDVVFEHKIGGTINAGGSDSFDILCKELGYSVNASVGGEFRGRVPGRLSVTWDPALAVSGAGYLGCTPFSVAVEIELFDDPDEQELRLQFPARFDFSAEATGCGPDASMDISLKASPGIGHDFDATLNSIATDFPSIRFTVAEVEVPLPGPNLDIKADLGTGPTIVGLRVDTQLRIENLNNANLDNSGVSFVLNSAESPFVCGAESDTLTRGFPITRENSRNYCDIFIKPCVLPGATFEVAIDPIQYVNAPGFFVDDLWDFKYKNINITDVGVFCDPVCFYPIALWHITLADGSEIPKIDVQVEQPCNILCEWIPIFCEGGRRGVPEPRLDLALRFTSLTTPGPGGVVPGQTVCMQLQLEDLHGHLTNPTFITTNGASQFAIDFSLFAPQDPNGVPLDILDATIDGLAASIEPGGRVVLPTLNLIGGGTGLIDVTWQTPEPTSSLWPFLDSSGVITCDPSSYIEAKLLAVVAPLPAEAQANNTVTQHFSLAVPDFSIERVATVLDLDTDDHRWLIAGRTMTLEATATNLGADTGAIAPAAQVPIFMTVQFIDIDAVEPVYTDTLSPSPIMVPAATFSAQASFTGRFHYVPPDRSIVSPEVYEQVVFTFTVNGVPSCSANDDQAPCLCEGGGPPQSCDCQTASSATLTCGQNDTLPPSWGGGPVILVPECDFMDNVGQIIAEYRDPITGDGDCDDDIDIDLLDHFTLVECLNGPSTVTFAHCYCMDFDGNGFVDARDYGAMQRNFNGVP